MENTAWQPLAAGTAIMGGPLLAARAFRAYLALAPNARDAAQIRARLEKLK